MSTIFGKAPNVFTIPAGTSFLAALSKGIKAIQAELGIAASEVTILLPTRRAIRAFEEHILKETGGTPVILPNLKSLGDLDEDNVAPGSLWTLAEELDLDPAIPSMTRRFLLQEELKNLKGHPGLENLTTPQRLMLADELARLFDQMHEEGVSAKALESLVPGELASHWQDILSVLHIVARQWPKTLAKKGFEDPVKRRAVLIERIIKAWADNPPAGPVIAAGSTGSKPATRKLLKAIAGLPKGAVIFPALDASMDLDSWDILSETHPQYAMQKALEDIGLNRGKVRAWPFSEKVEKRIETRLAFFREALRPPETTGLWSGMDVGEKDVMKTFSAIECPTPRIEAGTIAMILRKTLETPQKTAALITPDRALAGRVREELKRWGLDVDDSAGTPLTATPPGTFFALLAEMVAGGFSPVLLLAFLKHPLTSAGMARRDLLSLTRALDMLVLRGARPRAGLDSLIKAVRQNPKLKDNKRLETFLKTLHQTTAGFGKALKSKRASFSTLFKLHVDAARALSSLDKDNESPLLQNEDGKQLGSFVEDVAQNSASMGFIPGDEYPGVLRSLMETVQVRRPFGTHPRLSIWGTLEARLQNPDIAILAGLNEGAWPPEPGADPWMSREMRKALGLPAAEFRIGQSAHDFYLGAGAKEVILTRAGKVEGTPTTPSRWLQRIRALLKDQLPGPEHPWADWYVSLDEPDIDDFVTIAPPAPKPAVEHRPKQLSVTGVELWMRDPYAVYAKYILGLAPLDDLEMDPTAADRGILLHEIFETFMKDCQGKLPENALGRLLETGERAFKAQGLMQPSVRAFWWPRFVEVAKAFVVLQKDRQKGYDVAGMETKGALELHNTAAPFTLTAKADRIDKAKDGQGGLVIDYKTGGIPKQSEIKPGKKPQLPLEALMLGEGAFSDVGKMPVLGFEFWNIGKPEETLDVSSFSGDIDDYIRDARDGLNALVNAFADRNTPYLATPDPSFKGYGDFDPLSRLAEWQNKTPESDAS